MQEYDETMDDAVSMLKALADRNRLRIVNALGRRGELCACEITGMLGISAATVSRHMGVLIGARLVVGRKDGRWVHYRLVTAEHSRESVLAWVRDVLSEDGTAERDLTYLDSAPGAPSVCPAS